MGERTKLAGELEKTTSWVWVEAGCLRVEFYDFRELAQGMFGNDIAYTLTVHEIPKLFWLTKHDETSLIDWLATSFKSHFGIKRWLEENQIAFSVEIESWA
jgi:hypothetical protein